MAVAPTPDLLERALAGRFDDPDVCEWLRTGLHAYARSQGQVPLGRSLKLPSTPAKYKQWQRNRWLQTSAQVIQATTPAECAATLKRELDTFIQRGPWQSWQREGGPPESASELRRALYRVAEANDGATLSAKQIERVAGHVFRKKCPPTSPTIKVRLGELSEKPPER